MAGQERKQNIHRQAGPPPDDRQRAGKGDLAAGPRLSVVIPTLNAAASLPATLGPLAGVGELVVADGASSDSTRTLAASAGARVIGAPRGRGQQLRAGAAAAHGAWLLFLHADTRLDGAALSALRRHIDDPGNRMRAAYFRFALDDPSRAARRLERLVALRCRTLALPYGDQGLLVSRGLYDAVGGYAPIPLMEDVDLVRRIGRSRLVGLQAAVVTSAERYRHRGYLRRGARNLCILGLWFAGVPPRLLARFY
ncbi:MAG: TIGR04283 family arsenosugar biosynthesis glycosyltransferase [Acetobacteraceae bacterium]|nr:TIGR04283 family arsenosugar biosynthesis glycosyltransferase [Acetobacteraceae bacterium]